MEKLALEYCYKNPILHMDIIVPIERGSAEIIYAKSDGVVIRETKSGAYLFALDGYDKSIEIFESLPKCHLYSVKDKNLANYIMSKTSLVDLMEATQFANIEKKKLESGNKLTIKVLDEKYLDFILEHYKGVSDPNYIISRIADREVYGGFFEGELCGFIGFHAEGSMGILYILPKFRGKGFATELQIFMNNLMIDMGFVPYGQVEISNNESSGLQQKLGFTASKEFVYWIS